VQAAQHLGQYPGPLWQTFRKIAKRKNRNVAVVACARKLAVQPGRNEENQLTQS
jgi:hypothetical protein